MLFALTLLLLGVMVLMTLSIGSKIIEKNDLNHMADTAAYNQAVVVARTFNSISLINRTQVSHMVALASVQSLISWTGAYRGTVAMLRSEFAVQKEEPEDDCDGEVGEDASPSQRQRSRNCGCVAEMEMEQLIEVPLQLEEARIAAAWDQLDAAAAAQAYAIRAEAEVMYGEQLQLYRQEMLKEVAEQKLAGRMVDAARGGQRVPEELSAPHAGADVALRELGAALDCAQAARDGTGGGLGCMPNGPNAHAVWAAMGTRGFPFTVSRANNAAPFLARLAQILPRTVSVSVQITGSGYFADDQIHGMATTSNQYAWADDHLNISASYSVGAGRGCEKKGGFASKGDAWVKSHSDGDEHFWPSMQTVMPGQAAPVSDTAAARHVVPIMWPRFIDYNPTLLEKAEDSYGQPKSYAVVARDYALRDRLQPWEAAFQFGFSALGGSGLDLRSNQPRVGSTLQTSLSSGVAYYHRPGHWREPPNFLNPFWRATLVATDLVDKESLDDVPRTLSQAGAGDAARTFGALYRAGYRGY